MFHYIKHLASFTCCSRFSQWKKKQGNSLSLHKSGMNMIEFVARIPSRRNLRCLTIKWWHVRIARRLEDRALWWLLFIVDCIWHQPKLKLLSILWRISDQIMRTRKIHPKSGPHLLREHMKRGNCAFAEKEHDKSTWRSQEPRRYCVKKKTPDGKDHRLCDSCFVNHTY